MTDLKTEEPQPIMHNGSVMKNPTFKRLPAMGVKIGSGMAIEGTVMFEPLPAGVGVKIKARREWYEPIDDEQ